MPAACAARSPRSVENPPDPPPPEAAAVSPDAPINIVIDTAIMRFQIDSRTALSSTTDTLVVLDSVIVSGTASLRARSSGSGIEISATVERLRVTRGLGNEKTTESLDAPIRLNWVVAQDGITIQSPSAGCDQLSETARDALTSAYPLFPGTVARGQVWGGAQSLQGCRAGIAFEVSATSQTSVSNFAEAARTSQLLLSSESQVEIRGAGKQGATDVRLRGTGTTTAIYHFALAPTSLRVSDTHSRVELEFDLGYRTDRVLQKTVRRIERIR
jgi:hypothetical protein